MNLYEVHLEISKYLSRFKEQIKILNSNFEFSINIHAETFMIKVLDIIYDCRFQNLNYDEFRNYNSIDLGDIDYKLSIQVTATKKITKIKETLEKYIENNHYKKYERLKILVLTGRQENYSNKVIDGIVNGKFDFDINRDVIDLTTIYIKINEINELQKSLAVLELLKIQFSDIKVSEKDLISIESFDELKEIVCPELNKANRIFKDFGPNSSANSIGPVRWDLSLWYEVRRDKLVPLNNYLAAILSNYKHVIPEKYKVIVCNYLNHVYAFNKHVEDSNFDYSQYQFPQQINEIFCSHEEKNN